ncbi:hypothetical protein Q3H58_004807 [Pseudomonas psychrotolerans]|nr:hypothetical protein [Pseudomonas psychrotolerans]
MSYRSLGRSGLTVSRLNLGSMMFGGPTDEAVSRRIIDAAFAQGINFIDTANVYNDGESERVVGRAIAHRRHDWVLATKAGSPTRRDSTLPHNGGSSRKHLLHSVEQSLQRLDTDYIDLFYLHREDHQTPLEETVATLGELIRQGKIRYWGLSNHRGWKIAEVVNVAPVDSMSRRRSPSSRCTTSSIAKPRLSNSPPRRTMAWASCPTAPWHAACSPASTPRVPHRRPIPVPGATIAASRRRNGDRNPWFWRSASPNTPKPAASARRPSPWPGCWPIRW